jgi:hypothetical protein
LEEVAGDDELWGREMVSMEWERKGKEGGERTWIPPKGLEEAEADLLLGFLRAQAMAASLSKRMPSTIETIRFAEKDEGEGKKEKTRQHARKKRRKRNEER